MIIKGGNLLNRIFTLVIYITAKKGVVNIGWLSHPRLLPLYSIQAVVLHT